MKGIGHTIATTMRKDQIQKQFLIAGGITHPESTSENVMENSGSIHQSPGKQSLKS